VVEDQQDGLVAPQEQHVCRRTRWLKWKTAVLFKQNVRKSPHGVPNFTTFLPKSIDSGAACLSADSLADVDPGSATADDDEEAANIVKNVLIAGVFAITDSSFSFFSAAARRFSAPDCSCLLGIDPSSLRADM
jgi:hypothetical protein